MLPEWVEKHKTPGTTVKKIGNNYYLYYATSKRVPGKQYPVSEQTYIGKITEGGVVSERVAINAAKTEARLLRDLIEDVPDGAKDAIVLKVKKDWLYTKLTPEAVSALEERGMYKDGKVVL